VRADFTADYAITWDPLQVDAEPIFDRTGLCNGVAFVMRRTVVMRPKSLQELAEMIGLTTQHSEDAG
jgi:hypothetical protein